MGWIKSRFLEDNVGPGVRFDTTASGAIGAQRLVKLSGQQVLQCSEGEINVNGILVNTTSRTNGQAATVALSGKVTGVADVAITAGEALKCYDSGKVGPALTASKANATIKANVGTAFTNQPANDGVEIISSSASDTQLLDIWGTTNGGTVVVRERVTLTGTSQVATTKTDWGLILGVELVDGQPVAVGTITVREASGNAAITTITAGNRRSGVALVLAANQRAFNQVVCVAASGASTKVVGIAGTDGDGTEELAAVALAGTATKEIGTSTFRTVTKILVGDVESSVTATVKTKQFAEASETEVGVALETVVEGADVDFVLTKKGEFAATDRIQTKLVQISSAQMLALNATPVELVPAPGSGKALIFCGAQLHLDYNAAAYAAIATDDDLAIRYTNGSGAILSEIDATGFLDATADEFRWAYPAAGEATVLPATEPVANAALVLHMLNGEVTTGDSPLYVKVYFREVTLALV